MKKINYEYKNCPIPGGGYVPSFLFGKKDPDAFYIRTDVGGSYRFDRKDDRWIPINDDVTMEDLRLTYPIALATDENEKGSLFIISGIWRSGNGLISISHDYGKTYESFELPFRAHGNLSGRGTGSKLIVDKNDSDVMYYASQADGLWVSHNKGVNWEKCTAMKEEYLTLVAQSNDGNILVVGAAGVTCAKNSGKTTVLKNGKTEEVINRGDTLYVSYDKGESFTSLEVPCDFDMDQIKMPGSVPLRVVTTDEAFYITTAVMPKTYWWPEMAYSCDGGRILYGQVLKYCIKDGKIDHMDNITPPMEKTGISGIDVIPEKNFICVTSANKRGGDSIYRSFDDGKTWEEFLYGLNIGHMNFRTEYMTPKYNGGENLIHWLSDFKINPFDINEAWFNTGTGVFRTNNLFDKEVTFSDWSDGIEETVHINVYALPHNEVKVLDIVGDLGGFAFRDLDKACDNSFDDLDGNRYITCLNADFDDEDANHIVIAARGNWTGKTKGGLIRTDDGCKTYQRINLPYGIDEKLDLFFKNIEEPNVNPGFVATSDKGKNIIWSIADGIKLPYDMVIVSNDGGKSFKKVNIDKPSKGFKAFSDRVLANVFYGFDEVGRIYLSTDYGNNFSLRKEKMPEFDFALIDTADKSCVKFSAGVKGTAYISMRDLGLYKFIYDSVKDEISINKLSNDNDIIYRIGLGIISEDGDYFADKKAIYMAAKIDGVYGFYRTLDEGRTYELLSDDNQHFGEVNCIDGDCDTFGRFYFGTGGRGLFYAQAVK